MKKEFIVTYEESGKIKKTHIVATDYDDAFFFVINANRWILKIEEVKQ